MTRKQKSKQKRKHIRHSAYLCFRENGYHLTSIDDICSRAGISKGSFYWYYGAKLDVFIDILETWAREVIDELQDQFEVAAKNPNRIHLLGQAFEQEFHRARAIVPLWVEFSLLGRTDKEIQLSIGKFFRRARAAIAEILRESAYDRLSEPEVRASSGVILGAYMGVVLQEFADNSVDASQWSQDFVGILRLIFRPKKNIGFQQALGERLTSQKLGYLAEGKTEVTKEMLNELRSLIFSISPSVHERWIRGWGVIGYYKEKLIFNVKFQEDSLVLTIKKNVVLSDFENLLGKDKNKRKIKIVAMDQVRELKELLNFILF